MGKVVTLVTGSESTRISLHNQIKEYLPNELTITSFSLELNRIETIVCDILLLSSEDIKRRLDILGIKYSGCEAIVAKRTINFDNIDLIVSIPAGVDVLVVNDSKVSTMESIDKLKKIGINYLNYIPYYPGLKGVLEKVEICITIGEIDKVPPFVEKIYDIGTRIIDFQTISEILIKTGYLLSNAESFSTKYLEKIINIAKRFSIKTNKIINEDKKSNERIKSGFYAKYSFDDILGYSKEIKKIINVLKKLSKSDLTILIEGESGTGKEVFANSIHNESNRRDMPFIAINCSSLNDELIESELFGYEEGAFTGAKKGGKKGFFELAHKGTIFLDEIGDISLKMQAKLLRALQEKEIIKVGGYEVKNIDVRIIAATNKDLFKMVKNKEFRADLYYRLKMGYAKIPPLRERKEDIPLLCSDFINKESNFNIKISSEVIRELTKYDWHGNVRELKNTILYMKAICENNYITLSDFPPNSFFQEKIEKSNCLTDIDNEILDVIKDFNLRKQIVGRSKLVEVLGENHNISEYKIRKHLKHLEDQNYIHILRGRGGILVKSNYL